MVRGGSGAPYQDTIVIRGTQTPPLQEQWPRRRGPRLELNFKTVLAVRKDDAGKWWQAAWRVDKFVWGTPRNTAELEAAHETDEAKAAALTAVVAVKNVEPTCPLRLALREWQTHAGLDNKRVSALLRCDVARNAERKKSGAPDKRQTRLSNKTNETRTKHHKGGAGWRHAPCPVQGAPKVRVCLCGRTARSHAAAPAPL